MDPVGLLVMMLQTAAALLITFFVPGLALGELVAPGATTPLSRAGRAVGVSLLIVSAGCIVLARLGLLSPATTLAVAGASVALGAIARRRAGWTLRPPSRRKRRWLAGAAVGVAVSLLLVILPSRLTVGDSLLPYTSTVWYYANLARAVAALGAFPTALPEWGAMRPFQTDYLAVTAHTAATLQLLPGTLAFQIEAYRLAVLVAAIALATLLFRRWVSSWLALLGALLLLATARLEFKFLAYKPETFALAIALFALWLLDRALVERSRRLAVTAVAAGAITYLAHAEVFLVMLAFGAAIVVARVLVTGRGRIGIGRAPGAGRAAVLGATILVGSLVAGTVVNGALTGTFRIAGYVVGHATAADPAAGFDPALVPQGWVLNSDPTWNFYVAAAAPAAMGTPPPTKFLDSHILPRSVLVIWPGLDGRIRSMLLVLLALLAGPWLLWPSLDGRRRRAVLGLGVLGAGLVAGSYLLFAISHTFVPMRTGPTRILPYVLFLPVGAGTVGLWVLDRAARDGWRALAPRRARMAVAGAALTAVAAAMLWPGPAPALDDPEPGISSVGYEAYAWIDANLPSDARILANAYTDGAMAALAQRIGIVDGRAVYLEDPAFLRQSTALCLGARVVFEQPTGSAAGKFLAAQDVGYVLVVGPDGSGGDIGGYTPFTTDFAALAASRRYTLVHSFGDGTLSLYRVERGS